MLLKTIQIGGRFYRETGEIRAAKKREIAKDCVVNYIIPADETDGKCSSILEDLGPVPADEPGFTSIKRYNKKRTATIITGDEYYDITANQWMKVGPGHKEIDTEYRRASIIDSLFFPVVMNAQGTRYVGRVENKELALDDLQGRVIKSSGQVYVFFGIIYSGPTVNEQSLIQYKRLRSDA